MQLDIENETGTNLLSTCRELGISVFAYAPLGRGVLTGQIKSTDDFAADDFRRVVPRFSEEKFAKNLVLVERFWRLRRGRGVRRGSWRWRGCWRRGRMLYPFRGLRRLSIWRRMLGR